MGMVPAACNRVGDDGRTAHTFDLARKGGKPEHGRICDREREDRRANRQKPSLPDAARGRVTAKAVEITYAGRASYSNEWI
jgi:hypothetical protein